MQLGARDNMQEKGKTVVTCASMTDCYKLNYSNVFFRPF